MQGAVGLLIAVYLQIYQGISQLKKFLNRLRFDRIMVMSLWPRFFGSPCIVYTPNNYAQKNAVGYELRLQLLLYTVLTELPVNHRSPYSRLHRPL